MKNGSIVKGVAEALALAFLVASPSIAQQGGPAAPRTVASLASVEGSVLVSNPTGLAAGGKGAALTSGMRVITAANSRATVRFDDGCVVTLQPNQRYVVDNSRPCAARLLMVQSIVPPPTVALPAPPSAGGSLAGVALSGGLPGTGEALLAGIAGVTAITRWRRDETVSPN